MRPIDKLDFQSSTDWEDLFPGLKMYRMPDPNDFSSGVYVARIFLRNLYINSQN